MSQLKQTLDGDIAIEKNRFVLVGKDEEIRQRIIQNLKTWLEEVFTDKTKGIPWRQIIFQKGTPAATIENLIKNEILNTVGVIGLNSFAPIELNVGTRELTVTFSVQADNNPNLEIQETIP